MNKILLIFYPEGGNVEMVADKFIGHFNRNEATKISIGKITKDLLTETDYWIIGGSTVGAHVWQDANDSNKWIEFFKLLDEVDLSKKTVAFFGLGDQILYPNHFVNGLGVLQEEFEIKNAKIIGRWSIEGYNFTDSEGMKDGFFFGLALDQDNQEELTDVRITKWLEIVNKEFKK